MKWLTKYGRIRQSFPAPVPVGPMADPRKHYTPKRKLAPNVGQALREQEVNQNPIRLGLTAGSVEKITPINPQLRRLWAQQQIRDQFTQVGFCGPCRNEANVPLSTRGWCLKHEVFGVTVRGRGGDDVA